MIHPNALVEGSIGENTNVWAFAHIMKGAQVGANCNVGDHVFIEDSVVIGNNVTIKNGCMIWEGVTIEDGVFVGPGVIFTNDKYPRSPRLAISKDRYSSQDNWLIPTRICEGATIGAGAMILAGCTINRFAMVGAGSVVTKSVGEYQLVCGNPAIVIGAVKEDGSVQLIKGNRYEDTIR